MRRKEYKIGDVVRITNSGDCYTTYTEAFKYFGINDIKKLDPPEDYDKFNWVIIDIAKHGHFHDELIYYLKNIRNEKILSGSYYFLHRSNVSTRYTEHLKNKQHIIGVIPRTYI